jgi:sigma-B regulation protein RsbU (phosphoserine phosphatase)
LLRHRTELLESLVRQRTAQLARRSRILAARDRERTRSLRIAARIQRHILPSAAPQTEGLRISFAYHPLERVAGDFFDFASPDPDTLLVAIGDAAGHGVPAAFIALIVSTCLHGTIPSEASPAALLSAMNDCLYGWVAAEHFVSMFICAIDTRSRRMTFARAGHPHPLLLRADGELRELKSDGITLGVDERPVYLEQSVQLQPGDRVLFLTVGLPECRNGAHEMFGMHRLRRLLAEHQQLSGPEFLRTVVDEARKFTENHAFSDDVTLVLLDVTDPGGSRAANNGEPPHG